MRQDCKNNINPEIADKQIRPKPLFSVQAPRIHGLDLLRGICILLMVLDHISYDFFALIPDGWGYDFHNSAPAWIVALSDFSREWWHSSFRMASRLTVICMFFAISGISTSFSKNNFLRGFKLALASMILTIFTTQADKLFNLGVSILFGVLHCMTVAILLTATLELLLKDKAKYACLGLGMLFFIWGLSFNFLMTHSGGGQLFRDEIGLIEYLELMIGSRWYGADWFGIMPWAGIFLIGVYGGKELYKYRVSYLPVLGAKPFKPLCFVGRKAIWFYLLHQPVIMGIVALICAFYGISIL